ncbi:MAG TPA: M23 family metallopeptidase [Thiothrix sp.]|nr:M23 family metallopeptidase [Thiothrix sp.]
MKNTFSPLITYPLLCLLLLLSNTLLAFPKNSLKPGGIAIIAASPAHLTAPNVRYHGKRVALVHGKTNWLGIVGIPLRAKTGRHFVNITDAKGKHYQRSFTVKTYPYRTQRLHISNTNKVNPNKRSRQRIARESAIKKRLRNVYSRTTPQLNFLIPVTGRRSSSFGVKRILNGEKRDPHSGMDIAAPQGRSIKATAKGKVLYVGNLFYTGKVVYLDHGQGVISLYAHMSKIMVKKGQQVKRGQVIGKVGRTGRVTGAHLHWSVYLNCTSVDPALFLR